MRQKILFATNRTLTGTNGGLPQFNDVPTLPGTPISCAVATVDGSDPGDEDSGKITAMTALNPGGFAPADLQPVLDSNNDVLVFIHGAMNTFEDSITRAAYNLSWLAQTAVEGGTARAYDLIAFSWPGRTYDLSGIAAPINGLEGYRHDQSSAAASAAHIAALFQLLYGLRAKMGTRRMHLLAHSMGCYALGGAVESWFAHPGVPAQALFDEVVLAAADEECSTFTEPDGKRLSKLQQLGREITVYFNRNDILMHLSGIANNAFHLGYDGPPGRAHLATFPAKVYEFVNCLALKDYIDTDAHPEQIDHTHQYYRQSPTVRADIATTLAGKVPTRPFFYINENFHAFAKIDFSGDD